MKKCDKCGKEFQESELDISHDIPRYMFDNKNDADKYGRRYLCKKCHDIYERMVMAVMVKPIPQKIKDMMINKAEWFSKSYFTKKDDSPTTPN